MKAKIEIGMSYFGSKVDIGDAVITVSPVTPVDPPEEGGTPPEEEESDNLKLLMAKYSYKWAYYDPNDLSTLFQDVNGTIPVTALGQTIGRINDKSGNGLHLLQGSATKQPKLIQDSLTGMHGVLWDAVDDELAVSFANLTQTERRDTLLGFASVGTHPLSATMFGYLGSSKTTPPSGLGFYLFRREGYIGITNAGVYFSENMTGGSTQNTNSTLPARHSLVGYIENNKAVLLVNNDKIVGVGVPRQADGEINTLRLGIGMYSNSALFKTVAIFGRLTQEEVTIVNSELKISIGVV